MNGEIDGLGNGVASRNLINRQMNWITKILRRKEIKQCAILGIGIRFSRRQYDIRQIPELYFTKDYTIKNSVLCIKGDEYSPYMWNYDRMIGLIKDGILSENVC